jgi:hypothetical protein
MFSEMYEKYMEVVFPKKKEIIEKNQEIYFPFKLPITYVDNNSLDKSVIDDLELDTTIYNHLLKPTNGFGENMKKEWSKQTTTNIEFLKDTQIVLKEMNGFNENIIDTDKFMAIYNDTKNNKDFLEKYYYMDWETLSHLNESAPFLQALSTANVLSPLVSLLIPIIFLIFPFLILKIQGIPITFEMYINVLKDTARHHFIGKTLINIQSLSWDKLIYVFITFGLYLLQIYQNINTCSRFYQNVKNINTNLIFIRNYIENTTKQMDLFIEKHSNKKTYTLFCNDIKLHKERLKIFHKDLLSLTEFKHSFTKSNEVGYMMKCYHDLNNHKEYDESLSFSIGFEGYMNNMIGIYNHIESSELNFCTFTKKNLDIKEQKYPLYVDAITNDLNLSTNVIITGPNASGKTTLLKTTAINIIFSQQFGGGFYKKCKINPYHNIHSYLNIPDTSERDSLFQAESRRCKCILDSIHKDESRHFCLLDELYSGTNPEEAIKASYSFLSYLSKFNNVDFILTTHFVDICKKFKSKEKDVSYRQTINYKMNAYEKEDKIFYTYKLEKGISHIKGALRIFEEMGYPEEILSNFL